MDVEGVTGGRLCHSERILVLRPGNAVARGDRVECEEGCGGEGDANVRTCFAGDAGDASAKKVPEGTQSTQRVGSASPGSSDADTSRCARSRPPVPAPGRSRRHLRVNTLDGHAARSREPTDGPVPALPPPPRETHTQMLPCRICYACARCGIRLGNARACAPRASKQATRARRVPRIP